MSKKFAGFMIAALLMSPVSLSVRADDVTIRNQSKQPVKFEVIVPRTNVRNTITLQPGESKNPLGRSLSHEMLVIIYAFDSASKVDCGLSVYEAKVPYETEFSPDSENFYLPRVSATPSYRICDYKSNLPSKCNCFAYHQRGEDCYDFCLGVSNALVELTYR